MGGIFGDNSGEGNCESKIASRQWGDNFCRETSIRLAGPSGQKTDVDSCSDFFCVSVQGSPTLHRVLQGGAQRGGAILLNFCGSLGPSFVQQKEPFLPQNLRPREGNPLRHRLNAVLLLVGPSNP